MSDDGVLISKGSCVSDTLTPSSLHHTSVDRSVNLLSKEMSDGTTSERELTDDVKPGRSNTEAEKKHEEQQWNREEAQGEDVKERGSAGDKRGTLVAQTTDRADRQEGSGRLTEDPGDTKQPETETKDRAEGEGTDGAEERGKTGPYTPETQIPTQTTADKTAEESNTLPVIDSMDTEPLLTACEPSECSQNLPQNASEKVADSIHVNNRNQAWSKVYTSSFDDHQNVSHESNSVIQEVQHFSHDEAQISPHSLHHQVSEKNKEETSDKIAANAAKPSEPLNQSSVALPAQSDHTVSIQESETTTQTQPSYPSDNLGNVMQTDEMCDTHVRADCVLATAKVESHTLPQSVETTEQQHEELRSLVTDDEDDASRVCKKRKGQSNADTGANNACETAQEAVEKSNLQDACVDNVMDTVDAESEVETDSCQKDRKEDAGDTKTTKSDITLSAHPSHESDASLETGSKKSYQQHPAEEMRLDDTEKSSLSNNKTYRPSFDWDSAQRKTVCSKTKSDVSVPHPFVQVLQLQHARINTCRPLTKALKVNLC